MHRLKTLLAALLMLGFATTASAANLSCEGDPADACVSSASMPHCPMVPEKDMRAHFYCGSMCAAIAPSAHSVGTPASINVPVAQLPTSPLLAFNSRPEPPPPRG